MLRDKIKRYLAALTAGVFLFNDITGYALAPASKMPEETFRQVVASCYKLLAHGAPNEYIEKLIISRVRGIEITDITKQDIIDFRKQTIDLENVPGIPTRRDWVEVSKFSKKKLGGGTVLVSGTKEDRQEILVVGIDGLYKNTRQVGHIGLGTKNGMPTVYMDTKFLYDPDAIDEVIKDALLHEREEVAKYESKRRELEAESGRPVSYTEMREWVKKTKGEARGFHKYSRSLDGLYRFIEEHPEEFTLDLDALYRAYLKHGWDEDDADTNIAAHRKKTGDMGKMNPDDLRAYAISHGTTAEDLLRIIIQNGLDQADIIKDALNKEGREAAQSKLEMFQRLLTQHKEILTNVPGEDASIFGAIFDKLDELYRTRYKDNIIEKLSFIFDCLHILEHNDSEMYSRFCWKLAAWIKVNDLYLHLQAVAEDFEKSGNTQAAENVSGFIEHYLEGRISLSDIEFAQKEKIRNSSRAEPTGRDGDVPSGGVEIRQWQEWARTESPEEMIARIKFDNALNDTEIVNAVAAAMPAANRVKFEKLLRSEGTVPREKGWIEERFEGNRKELESFIRGMRFANEKMMLRIPAARLTADLKSTMAYEVREEEIDFNENLLSGMKPEEIDEIWWEAYGIWHERMISQFFNKLLEEYPAYHRGKEFGLRVDSIRERLREFGINVAGLDVLDVGTGWGANACAAKEEGARFVCGVDSSQEMLNQASANAAELNLENIVFMRDSATRLSKIDRKFDVVIARNTMSYLPPRMREKAIERMRDACRPGGSVVIMESQDLTRDDWNEKVSSELMAASGLEVNIKTRVIKHGYAVPGGFIVRGNVKNDKNGAWKFLAEHYDYVERRIENIVKLYGKGVDAENLTDYLWDYVDKIVLAFNPSLGVPFLAYMNMRLSRAVVDYMRKELGKNGDRPQQRYFSDIGKEGDDDFGFSIPDRKAAISDEEIEELEHILRETIGVLGFSDNFVLRASDIFIKYAVEGLTYQEIAVARNISTSYVNLVIHKVHGGMKGLNCEEIFRQVLSGERTIRDFKAHAQRELARYYREKDNRDGDVPSGGVEIRQWQEWARTESPEEMIARIKFDNALNDTEIVNAVAAAMPPENLARFEAALAKAEDRKIEPSPLPLPLKTFVVDARTGKEVPAIIKKGRWNDWIKEVVLEARGEVAGCFNCEMDEYNGHVSLHILPLGVDAKHRHLGGNNKDRVLKYVGSRLMQTTAILSKSMGGNGAINLEAGEKNIHAQNFYESLKPFGLKPNVVDDDIEWYLEPADADRFIDGLEAAIKSQYIEEGGWPKLFSVPKSTTTELLVAIRENDALLERALSENGIMPPSEAEAPLYEALAYVGVFERRDDKGEEGVEEKGGCLDEVRYRFTGMMTCPNKELKAKDLKKYLNYTKVRINVITGIKYAMTKYGKEEPLLGSVISEEKRPIAREIIKLHIADYIYTYARESKVTDKPYVIKAWTGYAAPRQKSFLTQIKNLTDTKAYQVSFSDIDDLITFAQSPDNTKDRVVVILPRDERILPRDKRELLEKANIGIIYVNLDREELKIDDLAPLESLIGAGEAYLNNDENSFYSFYQLLTGSTNYTRKSLAELKANPELFITALNFVLKPITANNPEEFERIRERLQTLLIAA